MERQEVVSQIQGDVARLLDLLLSVLSILSVLLKAQPPVHCIRRHQCSLLIGQAAFAPVQQRDSTS